MGNRFSKDAGLTADSIEEYYDALAKYRAACAAADETGENPDEGEKKEGHDNSTEGSDVVNSDSENEATNHKSSDRIESDEPASEIVCAAGVAPETTAIATVHLNTALRALSEQDKDKFGHAMGALAKLGVNINAVAKKAVKWVTAHPWETAAIVIPLILLACTPAILGAVGFTAGGIAAGSAAAGIQAGIGSVAAGSAFATLTSAAMGGYGALIVFGGVWAAPTAILGAIAVWKRWQGGGGGDQGDARVPRGDGEVGDSGDADGGKTKQE